ncbi:MAG: hypothetical protein ACE5OW_03485 [Candidatus Bathyarchaeia archaeon]
MTLEGRAPIEILQKWVKSEYLIVAFISIVGFAFYLWILTRHPLIYGIDGPYYLIQVRSLQERGSLEYGDPPLAFLLFTLLTLLVGGDITLGVRLGVALFSALSSVPLHFLVKRITRMEHAGYVAMLAGIFSAPHIRMMNDLLKNAVGVCFLLFFVYYLHDMAFTGRNRKNLFLASLFLVLTGATHILDFGVALLFLGLYFVMAVVLDINKGSIAKSLGILVSILGFFVAVAFTVFPSLFTDFYKGLRFLQDLFAASVGAHPILFLLDPRGGGLIVPVLTVGIVLTVYEWRKEERETALVLSTVTVIGWMLALPFIPPHWLWRFLLMEFIPVALILGYSASKMGRRIGVAIFFILCVSPLVVQSMEATRAMGPTINEGGYHELEEMRSVIPSNSVVVVHPRLGYWVQYVTRCDIASRPSPDLWRSYLHVLILHQEPPPPKLPPGSVILFHGNVFALVELPRPKLAE